MEQKQTIEKTIIEYLKQRTDAFGGVIEDYIRANVGSKGETTSRILRYMENDGVIEKDYVDLGHGKPNVRYRLAKKM